MNAPRNNAHVVWSAEKGWHDGEAVRVGLDDRGRLVTKWLEQAYSSDYRRTARTLSPADTAKMDARP